MINKIQKIIFAILTFVVLCSGNLFAYCAPLSFKEMVQKSDLILIGKVTEIKENSWVDTHGLSGSTAKIEVSKIIKGSLKEEEANSIFVRYAGSPKVWVEDAPEFKNEEKILLFLKKLNDNYYESVNFYAGKVEISAKNTVWIADEKTPYNKELTLYECIERIKKYMSLEGKNEKK